MKMIEFQLLANIVDDTAGHEPQKVWEKLVQAKNFKTELEQRTFFWIFCLLLGKRSTLIIYYEVYSIIVNMFEFWTYMW